MHGMRLDDTPKVLTTYTDASGTTYVLIERDQLSSLPFWYLHDVALFQPRTPDEARLVLFNRVFMSQAKKDLPSGVVYAQRVRMFRGLGGKYYLRIDLTPAGYNYWREAVSQNTRPTIASPADLANLLAHGRLTDEIAYAVRQQKL